MEKPNDYPISEILEAINNLPPNSSFYQKFTCSSCGVRNTMEQPNTLYAKGICEDCGKETNIEKQGCNYMLILGDQLYAKV